MALSLRFTSAALAAALVLAGPGPLRAAEFVVEPFEAVETKALFGRVESRFVVPARSRSGGTLVTLEVSEGSEVGQGQVIARVVDEKLEIQLAAAEARIRALRSELGNTEVELARNEELLTRGATTVQRVDQFRTALEVARNAVTEAEAARSVVVQQMQEGDVVAAAAGRVLTVPARLGAVVMPGETVATIAAGSIFLRLAIPERHAEGLALGAPVAIGEAPDRREGKIEKIYPQIESGRVIADVAVEGLSDVFVGQRVLVRVPVSSRSVLAVPDTAIERVAGLDLVAIAGAGVDEARKVTVVPGPLVEGPEGPLREILSGLRAGDRVIVP